MRRYGVTREGGKIVVTPDRGGGYRASTLKEIRKALTEPRYQTTTAEVLIGNVWYPLGRNRHHIKRKDKRVYSTPEPIKPLSVCLRILRKLHLYKDPLDALIYRG